MKNARSPFLGPALMGLAALVIALAWIFVFFAVIPPLFGGPMP